MCAGLLPGFKALAFAGSRPKLHKRLFMMIPVSPATTREPKGAKTLWIKEIAFPSRSAAQR